MHERQKVSRHEFEMRLRRKLEPEALKDNLAKAAVVMIAYELMKGQILRRVRGFYSVDDLSDVLGQRSRPKKGLSGDPQDRERYVVEVKALDPKSEFRACCQWLLKGNAMAAADVAVAEALHEHRQDIVHDGAYVIDPETDVNLDLVRQASDVLRRLSVFWGRINVDTNPDFDGAEISDDQIGSAPASLVDLLLTAVTR